jgi:two-component system OmpR family response regulator
MQILLIEDDIQASEYIIKGLDKHHYTCEHTTSGGDGLALALQNNYALIIVDRMLPVMDGITIVKKLRDSGMSKPILFLSALGEVDERVIGLKAGADDYLAKPFAMSELIARIEALIRRDTQQNQVSEYQVADLHLDLLSREVSRAGQEINLKPREFSLLAYLMQHHDQVVTRMMLLENVWDYHFDPQTNIIDVHVSRLRTKIDKPFDKPLLHTIRGAGYRLYDQ